MRRQWRWLWGLAVAVAIATLLSAPISPRGLSIGSIGPSPTQAQTAPAAPPAVDPPPAAAPADAPPEAPPPATPAPTTDPPAAAPPDITPLPLGATPYRDPESRFEIGVIEGFQVSTIANAPVIEAPDGRLAYTVAVRPKLADAPLSNAALAQAARETFQQGEGFRIQSFQPVDTGELRMTWTGQITSGGQSQPLLGVILAQQQADRIFLTLIAATSDATEEIPGAIAALTNSFQALPN